MRQHLLLSALAPILLVSPSVLGAQRPYTVGIAHITDAAQFQPVPRLDGGRTMRVHEAGPDQIAVHRTSPGQDTTSATSATVPNGVIGAVSGAILGASIGYRAVEGSDGRPSAASVRQYIIIGAVIGAIVGYGIESLVRTAAGASPSRVHPLRLPAADSSQQPSSHLSAGKPTP